MYIMHAIHVILNMSKSKFIISSEDNICNMNKNKYFEYSVHQSNCEPDFICFLLFANPLILLCFQLLSYTDIPSPQ
jgi:hypothetical protein